MTNNTRAIHFYKFNIASVRAYGSPVVRDPWTYPYMIMMDNGGHCVGATSLDAGSGMGSVNPVWEDDVMEDEQLPHPIAGSNYIQAPVAIYSRGADRLDNDAAADSDDVSSSSQ